MESVGVSGFEVWGSGIGLEEEASETLRASVLSVRPSHASRHFRKLCGAHEHTRGIALPAGTAVEASSGLLVWFLWVHLWAVRTGCEWCWDVTLPSWQITQLAPFTAALCWSNLSEAWMVCRRFSHEHPERSLSGSAQLMFWMVCASYSQVLEALCGTFM